ncbi:MAG: chemotaxis protein CheB [Formivibrio sp.]|nr:chemotaxis protein CheB [Formivibrio sp.]
MPQKRRKTPPQPIDTSPAPVAFEAHSVPAFPIVGIGASAGGLAAFEAFFSGLPTDSYPGMAFVLVQHLSPEHKSLLAELIGRCTRLPVVEVEDGMVVQANHVYIIPPGHDMAFLNGTLQLLDPSAERGQRLPIDFFFRSLAQDQHERAIGIVLSGTASDGTLGVRAIKGEGGMVMVQNPESTVYDGMPRSAIATGLVDYVLPPAEMPAQLMAYTQHAFGKSRHPASSPTPKSESALKKIFILLRAQTGHDFSQYKPNTILRRIERRMAVHQIDAIERYLHYLQQTPAETESLFHDLLIGVTQFFRDPGAFKVLEDEVIPRLFTSRRASGDVIRVWTTGCSTGEEAYSIAMLLQEGMEAAKQSHTLQVFATDIDSRAIATARAALYPASIAADISPERLARFFIVQPDGVYRVHKSLRDALVFSEQDVIKDPPFSRLDLISCRNLLIYLGAELQRKLIPLFHYALKPSGMLFLGTSEGIGDFNDLFAVVDRKAKLYQRKDGLQSQPRLLVSRQTPPLSALNATLAGVQSKTTAPLKRPLRELTEQALLQHLAPTAALVTERGDILYLHGRSGMYLELAPGETGVSNILKMAREGLRQALGMALHQVAASRQSVRIPSLNVKTNGHFTRVNLAVCPLAAAPSESDASNPANDSLLYLVIFEQAPDAVAPAPVAVTDGVVVDIESESAVLIAALRDELRAKDDYLQSTHEELESSNEELKSSNEEMQSVNEELQSTNEEMETSKEELQSVNEELATVNAELNTKVTDLTRLNNDMNNLLAGTGIATVFVDHQLHIVRFTPSASAIINLILSDVGRPVAHMVSNLVGYSSLIADTQDVLQTMVPKVLEVQTTAGRWYSMRIQPYRTLDNVIEGAVLSFVDITETVQVRDALRKANELLRLAVVVRDAQDAITVQDLDGRILAWNPGAARIYGWSEDQALSLNVSTRIPPERRDEALATVRALGRKQILQPYLSQRIASDGARIDVSITSTALLDGKGEMYAIATTERPVAMQPSAGSVK